MHVAPTPSGFAATLQHSAYSRTNISVISMTCDALQLVLQLKIQVPPTATPGGGGLIGGFGMRLQFELPRCNKVPQKTSTISMACCSVAVGGSPGEGVARTIGKAIRCKFRG